MKFGGTLLSHLSSVGTLDAAKVKKVRDSVVTERIA